MKKLIGLSLLIITLGVACDKDDDVNDTVKPVIESVSVNEETENVRVNTGSEMHVDAHLTDNKALGEFKIDIHSSADGHGHNKKVNTSWTFTKTVSLSGKEQHLHEHLDVPNDATSGSYHAVFRVIDAEGNEGDFVEIDFTIVSEGQPEINITDPDFSSEVHAPKGSVFSVSGNITDETDLAEIMISITEEAHDHEHGKTSEAIYEQDFDLEGSADLIWDFQTDGDVNIDIPASAETGYYIFKVRAMDNDGNYTIFEEEIHIM